MIRAIVNGDDFGISENVNEAVRVCFEKRLITNTTLMVNMPYADDAVEMAKKCGFDEAVGLHLNLTSGYPLTKRIRREKRFCRKDGSFNAYFQKHTMTRLFITRQESQAVAEEIEAQIRKYFSYGLPEKHLDSHHHVHTDRSVIIILLPLINRYGFKSVRLSRNMFLKMNVLKRIYKDSYNRRLKRSGLITADYFGSYRDLSAMDGKITDDSLIEVMVHPMFDGEGVLNDTNTPMEKVTELLDSLNSVRQPYFPVRQ
ncbi:MAG: ChbG/HpnK family deacetylase [Lachnospiraceae bacterium]|nr:ChbG/HpnK family deacetylase [Lachnospiraceae bacterium]